MCLWIWKAEVGQPGSMPSQSNIAGKLCWICSNGRRACFHLPTRKGKEDSHILRWKLYSNCYRHKRTFTQFHFCPLLPFKASWYINGQVTTHHTNLLLRTFWVINISFLKLFTYHTIQSNQNGYVFQSPLFNMSGLLIIEFDLHQTSKDHCVTCPAQQQEQGGGKIAIVEPEN